MRTESGVWTVAALGALSGVRSLGPSALVAKEMARRTSSMRRKRKGIARWLARGLPLLALGEILFDKAPGAPDRTDATSVLGRMAAGAALGAYVLRRSRALGAVVGGAAAVAATYASFALRSAATRRGQVPGVVAGLLEDGLMATAGSRLARALP